MLDIKFIRENAGLVKKNSSNRLATVDIDRLLELDGQWRDLQTEIQELRATRNTTSKAKPTPQEIAAMKEVGDRIADLENKQVVLGGSLQELLLAVPNLTHEDVIISDNEEDNRVVETIGTPPQFGFEPQDHIELGERLDLIDLERGAKVSGTKFYFLKNELALLQMALVHYVMDMITKRGFTPLIGPEIVKTDIIEKLGFNPRGNSTQVYRLEGDELSLIGTAEHTLGGYHADEVLQDLPLKYVSYSHCFRTEAGSYSKFSKGIFRVHQFEKVEMFVYCRNEEAESFHAELLEIQKDIFTGLAIPFRVVDHCTADLGNPSFRTFDLEAWLPGKPNKDGTLGDWAEITSVSNCTDYQSRGMNVKYKDSQGDKHFAYTLNGTGVATTRAIIAILENFQQSDGSVAIPEVLHKYLPFTKISRS